MIAHSRPISALVVVLLSISLSFSKDGALCFADSDCSWPMPGRDETYSRILPESCLIDPGKLKLLWESTPGIEEMSSCIPNNGRLFGLSYSNTLFCIDLKTYVVLWKRSWHEKETFAIDMFGDSIYLVHDSDSIREFSNEKVLISRIDIKDGRILWTADTHQETTSLSFAFSGESIFTAGTNICKMDMKTGKVLWKVPTQPQKEDTNTFCLQIAPSGRLILQNDDIRCLDSESGKLLWTKKLFNPDDVPAVIVGERLFLKADKILGISLIDGKAQKAIDTTAYPLEMAVGRDGKLFVKCRDGKLRRIDTNAMKADWTIGCNVGSSFLVDGNRLLVKTDPTTLALYDLKTLQPLWQRDFFWVFDKMPVAVGNNYIFSPNDHLVCINRNDGKDIWTRQVGMEANERCLVDKGMELILHIQRSTLKTVDCKTGKIISRNAYITRLSPSSPVIHENKVYAGCSNGKFYCKDLSTGKDVWVFGSSKGRFSNPVISKGRLYVASNDGYTYCLDPKTGDVVWKQLNYPNIESSLLVHQSRIFIDLYNNAPNFHCLDAKTGKSLWKFTPEAHLAEPPWNPIFKVFPTIISNRLYLGTDGNKIVCLDTQSGKLIWEKQLEYEIKCHAIKLGENILAMDNGSLYCFNGFAGGVVWTVNVEANLTAPLVSGGMVYLATDNDYGEENFILCLDGASGSQVWQASVGKNKATQMASCGNRLFCARTDGVFETIDAKSGKTLSSLLLKDECGRPFAVSDNYIVFSNTTGFLSCYGVGK